MASAERPDLVAAPGVGMFGVGGRQRDTRPGAKHAGSAWIAAWEPATGSRPGLP
jgi:hypothetical protein